MKFSADVSWLHVLNHTCFALSLDKGQEAVLKSGYIGKILEKFKSMASISDNELGNLPAMAYGCVNNISDDNGMLLYIIVLLLLTTNQEMYQVKKRPTLLFPGNITSKIISHTIFCFLDSVWSQE